MVHLRNPVTLVRNFPPVLVVDRVFPESHTERVNLPYRMPGHPRLALPLRLQPVHDVVGHGRSRDLDGCLYYVY